jgi:hypothetical protein
MAGCGGSDDTDSAAPTASVRRSPTSTAAPATTTTTAAPGQEDFTAILRDLLARRDEAYEKNDISILEEIYTATCPCLARAREVIAQRKAEGVHTAGERMRLLGAELINTNGADEAAVRVRYAQGPSRLVDAAGRTVREQPTEPPSSLAFFLARAHGRWKVVSITPEGPIAPSASDA